LVLIVSVPIWLLLSFAIAQKPPRILKPRWLQEEEAKAPPRTTSKDWFDVLIFMGTIGAMVITLISILLLVVLRG
jgi:hypothetical protein